MKSKDSTVIALPAKLKAATLTSVLKDLEKRDIDSTNYRIRTTFDLDVPILGERTFTIDQTRRMPAYHIPQFDVEGYRLWEAESEGHGCGRESQHYQQK